MLHSQGRRSSPPHRLSAGTGLGAYMMMPVDQFVLIDLPLGAYMARVDDSTFQLVIQEIAFFGFELRPIIKVRVTHSMYPRPSVILEAVEFRFDGSEIVRSLSDVSEVRGKTVLTWDEGDVDQAISSETSIRLYGKPPPPLNLIPRGVFESTANTIISTLLSAMQGPFVANIAVSRGSGDCTCTVGVPGNADGPTTFLHPHARRETTSTGPRTRPTARTGPTPSTPSTLTTQDLTTRGTRSPSTVVRPVPTPTARASMGGGSPTTGRRAITTASRDTGAESGVR